MMEQIFVNIFLMKLIESKLTSEVCLKLVRIVQTHTNKTRDYGKQIHHITNHTLTPTHLNESHMQHMFHW